MGDKTGIEWADATWNVITGCSVVSPGCTNCYAMRQAGTRLAHTPAYAELTEPSNAGPVWNGKVRLNGHQLDLPIRWKRPRRIFVNSMGDLFHENVPDAWIDRVFDAMALAHWHVFQVLTKRPERMQAYCTQWPKRGNAQAVRAASWPLPNVWLGVSAEDQRRADERIPVLLDTPAAVRWVSAEPLLGPIDNIADWLRCQECQGSGFKLRNPFGPVGGKEPYPCGRCREVARRHGIEPPPSEPYVRLKATVDWVVVGGESGPNARPMKPEWARSIRDACAAAGVPFHFKQWGEYRPVPLHKDRPEPAPMMRVGKRVAGRTLDGVVHNGYPS